MMDESGALPPYDDHIFKIEAVGGFDTSKGRVHKVTKVKT